MCGMYSAQMPLSVLIDVLESVPEFGRLMQSMNEHRSSVRLQALPNGVPMTLAALGRNARAPILVVTPRPEDARRFYEQICLWSDDEESILHFPESETLPFERLVTDPDTEQQRVSVLAKLLAQPSQPTATDDHSARSDLGRVNVVIASASAIAQKTISRKGF